MQRRFKSTIVAVLAGAALAFWHSRTVDAQGVPVLIDTALPSGNLEQEYRYTLRVVGGTAPYTWSVVGGSLPNGLTLDSNSGQLVGTPNTTNINNTFTIQAADSAGLTATRTFTFAVAGRGYRLEPAVGNLTVLQGRTASLPLQVVGEAPQITASIGFNLLTAPPAGVVAAFEPPQVASAGGPVNFVVAAEATAAPGTYPLNISAVSPPYQQSATINLIVQPPPPEITGFSPPGGLPGTAVTVRGTRLSGTTVLTIGGQRANFTVLSATQLSAVVPNGAATGRIVAATPTGNATSAADFVVPTFKLTVNPAVVAVRPGQEALFAVGITGRLDNLVDLDLGGLPDDWNAQYTPDFLDAQNLRSQLKVQVPADANLGDYALSAAAGVVRASATVRVVGIAPRLSRLTPVRGRAGTVITLFGQNFQPGVRLQIGSADLTVLSVSDTQVQARIPLGVPTGRIRLLNPDGQQASTSTVFVVEGAFNQSGEP
ncbi:IPT/TIG domain-containing protein [Gloeobacter morelensis]|uniref:IPT/TIG domain-containing protein n=1 Tax=Gloeobacter morelensis MG652769 TaxID=2781736 RepID=A0ABY3PLY3_9CYAN|nr:IPT/TIG domain-containing protein [Gloeobacter morelensis]UFP94593.1 IPT/TIG domain-containing protein [Gloeobacter morelensis MG652769]